MTATSLGSPAFVLDENILGEVVMRAISSKSGMGIFNFRPDGLISIILPAADVLKAARQSLTKADDEKSDEKVKKE